MRCCDLWGSHIFGHAMFLSNGWQIDDCWAVIGLPVCISSHVTTKALPSLDCRGCTCESAALCQGDNNRFFTGRGNKGERKGEEVLVTRGKTKVIGVQHGERQTCRERESRSDQLCSCRALYRLISETEHLCVAFIARTVPSSSQKNPLNCQINLFNSAQSTQQRCQKIER